MIGPVYEMFFGCWVRRMRRRSLLIAVAVGMLTVAGRQDGFCASTGHLISVQRPSADQVGDETCYVVLATDVSGSMSENDAITPDAQGRPQSLRHDAQMLLLQVLPFLHSNSYVGVAHFCEQVAYCWPKEDSEALARWQQIDVNQEILEELMLSIKPKVSRGTHVGKVMDWARDRIRLARQQHGYGRAVFILLTDGDPDQAQNELTRDNSPVLGGADKLAADRICVYPVVINKASYRQGRNPAELSREGLAAEKLMDAVAAKTKGKAYRITENFALPDIFMDIFGYKGVTGGRFGVSNRHWAVVIAGPPSESILIAPVTDAADVRPHLLSVADRADLVSGIRRKVFPLTNWHIAILVRPQKQDDVRKFWYGRWVVSSKSQTAGSEWRVFRIPDFLLNVEGEPALPWWSHEQVRVRVRLTQKPNLPSALLRAGLGDSAVAAALQGQDLSLSLTAAAEPNDKPILIEGGQWDTSGQVYRSNPFVLRVSGPHIISCRCEDPVQDLDIPLTQLEEHLFVHPDCVRLKLLKVSTNELLFETPVVEREITTACQAGEQLYAMLDGEAQFRAQPLSAAFNLKEPVQQQLTFRPDSSGRLVTDPITLPKQERRITGQVQVQVKTFAGVREIRLTDLEFRYSPAPLELKCAFSDSRQALWVGELHQQQLTISVSPVFEDTLDAIVPLFPKEIREVRIQAIDTISGSRRSIIPRCLMTQAPRLVADNQRTVEASYRLESDAPLPLCNKVEINLQTVMPGLAGVVKEYEVVDPIAGQIFSWRVFQPPSSRDTAGIADVLFTDAPVRFAAQWKANQDISGVSFEITRPSPPEPLSVELPVASGATEAQVDQRLDLEHGRTYPVHVKVAIAPPGTAPATHVKLSGGQFRAEERWLVLEELGVGGAGGADVPCWAFEQVELPVEVRFGGYVTGNARHSLLIDEFKESCALEVLSEAGTADDITDTIEWTSDELQDVSNVQGGTYTLKGHGLYTPGRVGRAPIQLSAELTDRDGQRGAHTARGHLFARDARFALKVQQMSPTGENLLFDSDTWASGQEFSLPVETPFSTKLTLSVRSSDQTATFQDQSSTIGIKVVRRPTAGDKPITELQEQAELRSGESVKWEVAIEKQGQYSVELSSQDSGSGRARLRLLTPALLSFNPDKVMPVILPSGFITERVRQWPFKYRIPVQQNQDWLVRSDVLAFRFSMPGMSDPNGWLVGSTGQIEQDSAERLWLLTTGPEFLPPLQGLTDGAVSFRLSYKGMDRITWEHPDVRVVAPWLSAVRFGSETAGFAQASISTRLELAAPVSLRAWPEFRNAPELEGWWSKRQCTVYVYRDPGPGLKAGMAPVQLLRELTVRSDSSEAAPNLQVHKITPQQELDGVPILKYDVPHAFWGWPRAAKKQDYAVLVAANYDVKRPSDTLASDIETVSFQSGIAEWSDVYLLTVKVPWIVPWCWWIVIMTAALGLASTTLKLLVPAPEALGLDVRLEEYLAVVEPTRLNNPVLVDIHETSLRKEIDLQVRFLRSRWAMLWREALRGSAEASRSGSAGLLGSAAGAVVKQTAALIAVVRVLLLRWLCPRRRAWAMITPKLGERAEDVQTGLVCVWTGPKTRSGKLWSSQTGTVELPKAGETKYLNVKLDYKMDNVTRNIPVTLRIRHKLESQRSKATTDNWQPTSEN